MNKSSFLIRLLIIIMCLTLGAAGLASCGSGDPSKESGGGDSGEPETDTVRLAFSSSGHVLNIIADRNGYLEEEGIKVVYVRTDTDAEVFEGINNGTIDVASSSGTNLPLERIALGDDLTIFAGYDQSGCLPVFSKVETEWNGIESLIGTTVAFEPNFYPITGALLDMGHDPTKEITWYNPENQLDRIKAVKEGKAKYGLVGTNFNYEIVNDPELKVCIYANEVMPDYSCCRVEARTEWVNENPNTVKALMRAWIRALEYYSTHHEEAVAMVVEETGLPEEQIRTYMDNPRWVMNTDPMKSSIVRAWNYLSKMRLFRTEAAKINIKEHINTDLYKSALDECQKRYGNDNPKFYENLQSMFAKYNLYDMD